MRAWMWHAWEGKQFGRAEFLDMDDRELVNILTRPASSRNPHKPYWPVKLADPDDPPVKDVGIRGLFFIPQRIAAMKTMGFSDEDIEERF